MDVDTHFNRHIPAVSRKGEILRTEAYINNWAFCKGSRWTDQPSVLDKHLGHHNVYEKKTLQKGSDNKGVKAYLMMMKQLTVFD